MLAAAHLVVMIPAVVAAPQLIAEGGLLKWADDGTEVALLGVNYYAPFAQPYREIRQLGLDHKAVIDADVAHLARLGLGVVRLHVWDREISDAQGHLLDNEHLRLLDYLIWRCRRAGIRVVLTPIAWWGSPENTHGFSDRFTMHAMTTDPQARRCQQRYLIEFVSHVNERTGLAYKDDPTIVAFEPINEPLYPPGTTDRQVVEYINALVDAIRSTGCRKPIFFNSWAGREKAVAGSRADGPSRAWYPTGLVAGASLWSNFLPRVAHFTAFSHPSLAGKPRIIYEFDAADVPGSYMYPAMARSFREARVQIATQFQYDCLPLAPYNLCWRTHFLNLVYTPAKALSLAIAAEVFRRVPGGASLGDYPASCRFGDFRVSYEEDLSEFVGAQAFMYSNDTDTVPRQTSKLARVWGCGSSPVVRYDGTGAYFLDRVRPGLWRLELYPDAVWVADPYGAPSLGREVSRLIWTAHDMAVRLPDLGADFSVVRIAPEQGKRVRAMGRSFSASPGVWLLAKRGMAIPEAEAEFFCPEPGPREPAAWCLVPELWRSERACPVDVRAVGRRGEPESVEVWVLGQKGERYRARLRREAPYRFVGEIPAAAMHGGQVSWAVALQEQGGWYVLPARRRLTPDQLASLKQREIVLWGARADRGAPALHVGDDVRKPRVAVLQDQGLPALHVEADGFGPAPSCVGFDLPLRTKPDISGAGWALCVEARALYPQTDAVEVTIRQSDGAAFGANVPLSEQWEEHEVAVGRLRHMWRTTGELDLRKAAGLTVVFGAWLYPSTRELKHGFALRRVSLKPSATWTTRLLSPGEPIPLVAVRGLAKPPARVTPKRPAVSTVAGSGAGKRAVRLVGGPFGPEPDSVSIRYSLGARATPAELALWREDLGRCRRVVIVARAGQPNTTAVEIVFIEEDGSPWGMVLPLETRWRKTVVPIGRLTHFRHWRSGPKSRGREGDRLRPEKLDSVNICFGAWLYGDDHRAEKHVVDIELVGLAE